jgi:hypothetical protein
MNTNMDMKLAPHFMRWPKLITSSHGAYVVFQPVALEIALRQQSFSSSQLRFSLGLPQWYGFVPKTGPFIQRKEKH